LTTAEALRAITDRGLFESLVISVLHKANIEYQHILQTGINAAGETIRSPVDGFCQIPESSPPHFLIVQCTTTEIRELERKWLHDHVLTGSASANNDGDLVKSGRLAHSIRENFPHAKFTVILATNQRVDMSLSTKVYTKAKEFDINCVIWDQSRLTDFLDNDPDGQWLRKKYLDIEAERLSGSLLHSLCGQSLAIYERELQTNPDIFVPREVDRLVQEGVQNNRHTLQLLVGESGFGKSIAAYRALQEHLKSNGYGLWAPTEMFKECTSLEKVIGKVLQDLHSPLSPDVGKVALQLAQEGSRFLIVVDDLNRAGNPSELLHKIFIWSKPQHSSAPNRQSPVIPFFVMCPIWPHIWESENYDLSKTDWIHPVLIGPMTSTEGTQAVHTAASRAGITITINEANTLATDMGNDPILIGLFSLLLSHASQDNLHNLAGEVIEKFIIKVVKETASTSNTSYLPNEYHRVLSTLSMRMLQERKFYPSWMEIKDWLEESSDINVVRELIQNGKLCRLNEQARLVFRHDRIQKTLMVETMATILARNSPDLSILGEPFYAEIIGQALVHAPQTKEFLTEMQSRNPLALVEAIRCFGILTLAYHQAIIEEVKKWVENKVTTGSVPDSVVDAVCWSLIETDSPAVLEITSKFPSNPLILLARLRNGCAKSGALYCNSYHDFAPRINDDLRDQIIAHAKQRHKTQLLMELKQLLEASSVTDEEREGALVLAGFLGFTDLQDEVTTCWKLVKDKTRVLPEAIWAATRCCGAKPNILLDPLIAHWANLPDKKDSSGMSQKEHIAELLNFALTRGISSATINYLIGQCNVHESLRWPIIHTCDSIDDPDAIEFVVRSAADIERSMNGTDSFSPWTIRLKDKWSKRIGGRNLSQTSLDRLRTLWEDPENNKFMKKQAFRLWLTGIGQEQIQILRSILTSSPLFREALWKRVQLKDYTTIPDLVSILSTDTHWFNVAHHVWCNKLMVAAQYHLESFESNIPTDFSGGLLDPHYNLSELLLKISVKDAEMLLDRNWGYLGYSPLFIQTALYVGTPRCLELAAYSITQCPKDIPVFKHLNISFGFLDSERQKYLTVSHLDNLLPFLDRLDEQELWHLAEVCQRLGIPEWSQQHLSDRLSAKERKSYHPSDDDLLQDLTEFAGYKQGTRHIKYWLEGFDKRKDSKSHALTIIDRWLGSHPTIECLRIAAACIQVIGTRKDLSILEKYTIKGSPDEIAIIKESTWFSVCRRYLSN